MNDSLGGVEGVATGEVRARWHLVLLASHFTMFNQIKLFPEWGMVKNMR